MEPQNATSPVKSSFLKKILKAFLWLVGILLLGMALLLALLFVYQDEVKATIIKELNKHLNAEVKIDPRNIDLTIISSFPDCSIEFRDVLMLEAVKTKNKDTLLFAGKLNLHFNVEDLWNEHYEIKKIKLKEAIVKLKVFKDGSNNYQFWKEDTSAAEGSGSLQFKLTRVEIDDSRLLYKDRKRVFKTELDIEHLVFGGSFGESHYELLTEAKLKVRSIAQAKTTYLRDKNCRLSLELNVANNNYEFKKATVHINRLLLDVKGEFAYSDSLESVDLNYQARELEIASLLSLLPEQYKSKISDYESSGNLYASGKFKYSGPQVYSFVSDFGIQHASITYKPQSTTAEDVNLEGHLKLTGASSLLELKNIQIRLGKDEIKGLCTIRTFKDPFVQMKAQASVNLENLQKFWPIDTLTELKGRLTLTTEAEGLLSDLKDKTFSTNVRVALNAHVAGLEARFKGDDRLYTVENCSVIAGEREIEVKDLLLKRGASQIKLNGKAPGLFNHLVDRSNPLMIIGSIQSPNLKLEDFLARTNSSTTHSSNNQPLIPANLFCKLNAAIEHFEFGTFQASAITGELEIRNQKAMLSDMRLSAMGGEADITAFADNSGKKLEVVLQSHLKDINISTMFKQLNNFGQETLKDENLKGYASATVDLSGNWSNALEADLSSLKVNGQLSVQKGELIDFKPLLSLSRFVDVDELKRIKFSSLQSNIEIRDQMIHIPRTSIKNSALNVEIWGTHSFKNDIDYHIQLLISELLAKKRKNPDSEFGPIEKDQDNKRSAFLSMKGTIDNPIIKYDKKGLKEKIGEDIKKEKQSLKQLFKEEFGLFKKDSLPQQKKKSDHQFELETPGTPAPKKALELKKKEEEEDF